MKKFIYSMSLVLATSLVACTEDYKDWAQPQQVDQPEVVSFGNGSVSAVATIDLAEIAEGQEWVSVCNVSAPTSSDEAYNSVSYKLILENADFDLNDKGQMRVEELKDYLVSNFGRAPEEHELAAIVEQWISNGANSIKTATSAPFAIKAKLDAPVIEEAYYITGSINGWDNANTDYKLTNGGGDVYEDPIFTIMLSSEVVGEGFEFKLTPESGLGGDWSKCIASGDTEGTFNYDNKGDNLAVAAIEGAVNYKLTFDMLNCTWSYEGISYQPFIYFIGATDGWSNAEQKLALVDAANGIYTGFIYCADPNGWGNQFKFQKEAGNWGTEINSGDFSLFSGDATDCGGNIGVAGGESVYYFNVNLSAGEIYAEEVLVMGLIGDFNGWGGDVELTWNPKNYCFEGDLSQVTSNGWKFRVNEDWAINLGGKSLNDLEADGANLTATGSTIQLYPTRRDNDNIYATVDGAATEDPEPGDYAEYLYYIGATDGWANAEQKLALVDDVNGVYTGFIYCADPNGWGNQFKFQKEAGNWGTEINSGDFSAFSGDAADCGGNIGVAGGESVYYFSVNLGAGEIYAEEVKTMGIIGDFNGWGSDLEMTWNADEYCFEAGIAEVNANGWKFRLNGGWDINLGGAMDNLESNGDNLSATGSTCKLYPTRKDSDTIYCVVE